MKTIVIATLLFFWMVATIFLALSFIGWVLIMPTPNETSYYKPLDGRRSTWMSLGHDLKNTLINIED